MRACRASRPRVCQPAVEEVTPSAFLDLYDPEIGIKFRLARQVGLYLLVRGAVFVDTRDPLPIARRAVQARWRRSKQQAGAIEPVDADEDGAGIVVAVTYDDCRRT